jgi:hypothetical protein
MWNSYERDADAIANPLVTLVAENRCAFQWLRTFGGESMTQHSLLLVSEHLREASMSPSAALAEPKTGMVGEAN